MIFVPVLVVFGNVLFNCCTKSSESKCESFWQETGTLQFYCHYEYAFEHCGSIIVANPNVTKVIIRGCVVNKFPTELFAAYRNLKGLEIHKPHLDPLSPEDFIGANQLEDLSLRGGQLNLSASTFVHAPKLKNLSIEYTDVTYIDSQAFKNASALETLKLKINSNATWPEGLLDSPTNLKVLDLNRYIEESYSHLLSNQNDLENLRIPVDNNIKLLKFRNRNVIELNAETFVNFTQLTMLLLGGNGIERIWPYTFVRKTQLILLELQGNNIQELTQPMLAALSNLRAADFAYNDIRHIESEAFSSTPQLRRLDLSYNKIATLEPRMFNNPLKIHHLDLYHNHIGDPGTVDLSLFCNLPNLSFLSLGYNNISKLKKCTQQDRNSAPIDSTPENTLLNTTMQVLPEWQYLKDKPYMWIDGLDHENDFSGLLDESQNISAGGGSRLTVLNLSWNELSEWEDNLFDTFVNLRTLDLSRNPIKSLSSAQFNGLGNLLILQLNDCQLSSLDFNVFSSLVNLKKLHLVRNRIQTIAPPGRPMNRLVYLELSENGLESTLLQTDAFRESFNLDKLTVVLKSKSC